jgi:hypothetical protein
VGQGDQRDDAEFWVTRGRDRAVSDATENPVAALHIAESVTFG